MNNDFRLMCTVSIVMLLVSVCYSQQQVWIQEGNPYDQMRMYDYLKSKGVPDEMINPPIGYPHGILRYPVKPQPPPPVNLTPVVNSQRSDEVDTPKALPWLVASALVALAIGPRFGHRRWTSFTAGLLLGPLGILLVTSSLTLQRPTVGRSKIVSVRLLTKQQQKVWGILTGGPGPYPYEDG
jgi:hypothetical protein